MNLSDITIAEGLFHIIPLLHDRLVKPFESTLREELSPMQFYTLMALYHSGCMTMTELATHFGIPKQQMTKIINHLVELGIAERRTDDADRRLVKICVTVQAEEYILKYKQEICRLIASTLKYLETDDKQRMLEAISTIHSILPKLSFQNRPSSTCCPCRPARPTEKDSID